MRISKVARESEVGVETIRFYERRGLIEQPLRPANGGYRSYSPDTIDRIRLIRRAQRLGFSLGEIDELLSLKADPSSDCTRVRRRAQTKLDDVNQKIAELETIRSALQNLVDACPGAGVAARRCSIFEALEQEALERVAADDPAARDARASER